MCCRRLWLQRAPALAMDQPLQRSSSQCLQRSVLGTELTQSMSEHHGADMLQQADQLAGTTADKTTEHAIHSLHQCTMVCSCAPGYDLVQVVPSREALKFVSACYTDLQAVHSCVISLR